jgi:hypothetical protein
MTVRNDYSLVYDKESKEGFRWISPQEMPGVDAKGDIMVGTADDNAVNLPIGPDGSILIANSVHTSGMSWDSNIEITDERFDIGGKALAGVGDPSQPGDVSTKFYVDTTAAALAIALG